MCLLAEFEISRFSAENRKLAMYFGSWNFQKTKCKQRKLNSLVTPKTFNPFNSFSQYAEATYHPSMNERPTTGIGIR